MTVLLFSEFSTPVDFKNLIFTNATDGCEAEFFQITVKLQKAREIAKSKANLGFLSENNI